MKPGGVPPGFFLLKPDLLGREKFLDSRKSDM